MTLLPESDEHRLLRSSVRGIAERYGPGYFRSVSDAGGNPSELWRDLGASGFLGVNISERYGGGGMGVQELVIVTEEVAAAGTPLLLLALSPAVCAVILERHGSDEQREEWLPGLASGEKILAFAITEPDAGSNAHNISTQARRDGDDWILSGTKHYVSHLDNCDGVLVVARTGGEPGRGRTRLTLFLVPARAPGMSTSLIEVDIVSPERQFVLHLDSVRLSSSTVVGEVDEGMRPMFDGLNPERLGSAAIANGIARHVLDRAATYARQRVVWDVPIGAHQGVAHPLARAHVHVELARTATSLAAAAFDRGEDPRGSQANLAKYASTRAADLAIDAAMQVHGGNGVAVEYGIAQLWGLVRLLRIAPVSEEMTLNHIAQHELGLPRSY